jgi:hypothetical protein
MNGRLEAEQMVAQHEAANEIERLRLTDAEREAIEQAIDAASGMAPAQPWAVATLRGLLERLSPPTT